MSASERHYSVPELAALWGLSQDTIRSIFRGVPGILRIARPETRRKRSYTTIRIPESVAQRVHSTLGKAV